MVALRKFREGVEVRNMGAWSREIARRIILDHWKKNARRNLILAEDTLDAIDQVFAETDAAEDRSAAKLEALTACLAKLPAHLRELVDLFYKEKMSLEKIGRQLRRSSGAVQVSLSRTRRTLLECVEKIETEEGAHA
jgi:RNA polymerase sigma factor (sigma-70 family)